MTPLPAIFGGDAGLVAWRLDRSEFASAWNTGEGARRYGGRWNSRGRRVVYCSIDPATALLETAAHIGFDALDVVAHVLTSVAIRDASRVHVVAPADVPDASWLRPGHPGAAQQAFGDAVLSLHPIVLIPSVVSTHSWNLLFDADAAASLCSRRLQEDFVLDPRLHSLKPRR